MPFFHVTSPESVGLERELYEPPPRSSVPPVCVRWPAAWRSPAKASVPPPEKEMFAASTSAAYVAVAPDPTEIASGIVAAVFAEPTVVSAEKDAVARPTYAPVTFAQPPCFHLASR